MKKLTLFVLTLVLATAAFAQTPAAPAKPAPTATPAPPPPSINGVLDRQLSTIERELVPLAEAMPADKYDFKPTGEGFKDVRMFKQQVGHIAAVLELLAQCMLEEPVTVTEAEELHGPASLKTKDDYVKYLKAAFAHAHKAINATNDKNMLALVDNPVWKGKGTRLGYASILAWHSNDHYGQLVEYLRMNNIIPPASRGN